MKKSLFSISIMLCCLLSTAYAQRFGKLLKDTPGAVSFTFRNEFSKDVPGTLDKVKAMGITNIEFSNLFGKTAAELRALLDERGMRCSSLGVSFGDLNDKTETVVQNAKTLGAEFVRIGSVPHKGPMDEALAKKTVEDFNRFGQKLKDNDLTFCYQANHGFGTEPYEKKEPILTTLSKILIRCGILKWTWYGCTCGPKPRRDAQKIPQTF